MPVRFRIRRLHHELRRFCRGGACPARDASARAVRLCIDVTVPGLPAGAVVAGRDARNVAGGAAAGRRRDACATNCLKDADFSEVVGAETQACTRVFIHHQHANCSPCQFRGELAEVDLTQARWLLAVATQGVRKVDAP